MGAPFLCLAPAAAALAAPLRAHAAEAVHASGIPLMHPGSLICLFTFVIAYIVVLFEEKTDLRKSKPVLLASGIIWLTIGLMAPGFGIEHYQLREAAYRGLEEYGGVLLFLLAAMTYISALQDRQVFNVLRAKLTHSRMSMKQLFWATGILAFFLSPVADNLTTALVMGTVVVSVGARNAKFITLCCINIVSAANAGGVFSPFGDITSLMVWQAGKIPFFGFAALFIPSVVCFLVPATIMSYWVSNEKPAPVKHEAQLKRGAKLIIFLGLLTIALAVSFEQFFGLPAFLGMMAGLSLLMITAYFIRTTGEKEKNFDIMKLVAMAEWDTLLFFFGVIFSIGGLSFLGYLDLASRTMYEGWGPSVTNISLGPVSALIDNIPVMFAVLTMNPDMNESQWLLVTLTTGVGGSLLSVGSAAGVALMGTARGSYTFLNHLKWTPVLALGYVAALAAHFLLNT